MSLFSKLIIFSGIKGVVLDHGTPVSGVEIERFITQH
jgi:hypothetical protein